MTGIVQALVLIVVGGFVTLIASTAGSIIGKSIGSGLKTVLVSILTTFGFAHDTAVTVAQALELVATTISLTIAFVLFIVVSGFFDGDFGRKPFSLIGIFRIVLMIGGGIVLLVTAGGIVVGTRGQPTRNEPESRKTSNIHSREEN